MGCSSRRRLARSSRAGPAHAQSKSIGDCHVTRSAKSAKDPGSFSTTRRRSRSWCGRRLASCSHAGRSATCTRCLPRTCSRILKHSGACGVHRRHLLLGVHPAGQPAADRGVLRAHPRQGRAIGDPFEQVLFLMLHLPYLQPSTTSINARRAWWPTFTSSRPTARPCHLRGCEPTTAISRPCCDLRGQ